MTLDLPTTTGPRGSLKPDWSRCEQTGGVAPGVWRLAPDQPAEPGMCRVRVAAPRDTPAARPDTTAAAPKRSRASLPCAHKGEPAGPKGWHVCEHEDEPLGLVVCACRGCGPRCPGYATR